MLKKKHENDQMSILFRVSGFFFQEKGNSAILRFLVAF